MSTLRTLISSIRSIHKILSTDALITDRAIAAEIKMSALLLIKRESNLRKLWATDTIFTTIPCLEMEEIPISECGVYVDDCTISRSKFKIPQIAEGNYQYVIQGIYSINILGGKGKKLKEITINRYINLLNLPIIKKEDYFWISDNYLYVTNPFAKMIRIVAFFQDDIPSEIMFSECNCGSTINIEERCKNPLDRDFSLPGYLEKQVLDLVSQKLLQTYFNLKTDLTSEGIDSQSSNQTK